MEWVASTLHTTSEHGVSPADLNGLVRYDERLILVSARVQSHFKHRLQITLAQGSKDCGWEYFLTDAGLYA